MTDEGDALMTWTRNRPPHPYEFLPLVDAFHLESSAGRDGDTLPATHRALTHAGNDVSPPLSWQGAPESTQSYAVTCYDIDAPTPSGVWHWIVVDVPATTSALEAGAGSRPDAMVGASTLTNDLGTKDYAGAAPPAGDHAHRYLFTVHALSVPHLPVPEGASTAVATFILGANTIGRSHLVLTV